MIKELTFKSVQLAIDLFAQKKAETLGLDLDPLAPAYMQLSNYLSKKIKAVPRKVTLSKKFAIPDVHLAGYEKLVKKIENGEDINMYLSKGIDNTMFSDRLLDDYGCVHFHLGNKLEGKYIKRTGLIALAFVTHDEIFFIETKLHGKDHPYTWTDKSVLEILHNERPKLIERNKASILRDISPKISEAKDIKDLRISGHSFGVTLADGSVYIPSKFGQVTVGSSNKKKYPMLAVEHWDRMIQTIREIYFFIKQYIISFKLKMNCTITNIEIMNLQSNEDDLIKINKFDIKIHYLKEFVIFERKTSFIR